MKHKTTFFRAKQSYLPHISRLFTVRPISLLVSGLMCGFLASFLVWSLPLFYSVLSHSNDFPIAVNRDVPALTRSYDQWKQVVADKPEYRDGYVMLAWYAKELGKTEETDGYIQQIKKLDPNYPLPEMLTVEK